MTRLKVDGLGTVTVRGLDEPQVWAVLSRPTLGGRTAALIERGLVDPPLTDELARKLGKDPDLCARVHAAIQCLSWPAV